MWPEYGKYVKLSEHFSECKKKDSIRPHHRWIDSGFLPITFACVHRSVVFPIHYTCHATTRLSAVSPLGRSPCGQAVDVCSKTWPDLWKESAAAAAAAASAVRLPNVAIVPPGTAMLMVRDDDWQPRPLTWCKLREERKDRFQQSANTCRKCSQGPGQ